jgi:hypothetical protein
VRHQRGSQFRHAPAIKTPRRCAGQSRRRWPPCRRRAAENRVRAMFLPHQASDPPAPENPRDAAEYKYHRGPPLEPWRRISRRPAPALLRMAADLEPLAGGKWKYPVAHADLPGSIPSLRRGDDHLIAAHFGRPLVAIAQVLVFDHASRCRSPYTNCMGMPAATCMPGIGRDSRNQAAACRSISRPTLRTSLSASALGLRSSPFPQSHRDTTNFNSPCPPQIFTPCRL